jgi:predicted nucleic acid-binding protein
MVVMDASVAVEVLIRTELGRRIAHRVLDEDLHAPHLIDLEFLNALRRLSSIGGLDPAVATEVRAEMTQWSIERHSHFTLLEGIWNLRNSVSVYDAVYVALAETLGVPLLTCDGKLSRSHGHKAKIVLLS